MKAITILMILLMGFATGCEDKEPTVINTQPAPIPGPIPAPLPRSFAYQCTDGSVHASMRDIIFWFRSRSVLRQCVYLDGRIIADGISPCGWCYTVR